MSAVRVTRVRDRIHVKVSFGKPVDRERLEALGARWSRTANAWTLKLSMVTCQALRAEFGDRLVIGASLRDWAWEQRNKNEQLERLRSGDVPSDALDGLKDLAPALYKGVTSRPYQVAGAAFALTGGNVLLGDQPGLGKTWMALAAMVASKAKRILIICPRTAVRSVWESHIRDLCPFAHPVVAQGSRANRETQIHEYHNRADSFASVDSDHVIALIVNKEMIRVKRVWVCATKISDDDMPGLEFPKPPGKRGGCPFEDSHQHTARYYPEYPELFGEPWDYIIMDEAHHALASRYNVQSNNITQLRLGAMRLPLANGGRKLAMSGTPYRSRAQKAWGTLNWLNPKEFSSFWAWADELFKVTDGRYAREVSQTPRDAAQFQDRMRPYLIARTKAEVAPELPPIEYAGATPDGSPDGPLGVWLDMDPAQAKAYGSMVKLAEAGLRNNGRITATGVLAELTRLRQFACSWGELESEHKMTPALPSNKYDWLLDFLREREGFGGKVIIASQFTGLLKLMANHVYKDMEFRNNRAAAPLILHGGTTDRGREEFQKRIQDKNDPAWIGFINMHAGGEAITLDQADDMIILDNPWISDVLEQMENRLHRISRIHQVTVYRLQSLGTIEQGIAELTDQQRADLMALRPEGKKILAGLFE